MEIGGIHMGTRHKHSQKKPKEQMAEMEDDKNLRIIVGYPKKGQARDNFVGRLVIWADVVKTDKKINKKV